MASGRVNKNSKYCQYRMLDKDKPYFQVIKCKREAVAKSHGGTPLCNSHLQEVRWATEREEDVGL